MHQIVLQEYVDAVRAATTRVNEMMQQILKMLPNWSMALVVDSLAAFRGIDKLAAASLCWLNLATSADSIPHHS